MNINLYNISDNPIKVKKSADKDGGLLIENVRFKDDDSLNVLNPTLVLNLTTEISDSFKYNYVYIPKTTRFYYITNVSTEGGLTIIETKVDVLYSFMNDILNSKQYILRQENKYKNPYLMDNLLPITSQHNYVMLPFGDNVDDRSCGRVILETAGKGGRVI